MEVFYGILIFIGFACSVPPDYCFPTLNQSDCKLKPTPVFSYYKPGSRCDIYVWRGCPTLNKFDNEFDCSHLCIARLGDKGSPEKLQSVSVVPIQINEDPCMIPLNTTNCSNNETLVFTFHDGSCLEAIWRGCPTQNKFTDEDSCNKVCKPEPQLNLDNWKSQLKVLNVEEVKDIDIILEDVVDTIQTTSEVATVITTEADKATELETTSEADSSTTTPVKSEEATTAVAVTETTTTATTTTTTTATTTTTTTTAMTTTTRNRRPSNHDIGSTEEVITT